MPAYMRRLIRCRPDRCTVAPMPRPPSPLILQTGELFSIAIDQHVTNHPRAVETGLIAELADRDGGFSAQDVARGAEVEDGSAQRCFQQLGDCLGFGLASPNARSWTPIARSFAQPNLPISESLRSSLAALLAPFSRS
jgi:hypothetical protein